MLYMALELGIGAAEFWDEFTPRAILLLAKQKVAALGNRSHGKGWRGQRNAPLPKINRIPR